jgi:uncharacterized protein with von Willebrand factor type A (vWA) domain
MVFLVDVSGSMAPYAESLLRLAHVAITADRAHTEVFTIGTRLTRVTRALRMRDPEAALAAAGRTVPDWSGGTRLGESLRVFLDRWGRRGVARALLAEQMSRLQRLAHHVVWSNPHLGKPGYAPVQSGIVAALPYVDALVAGHSLAAFAELLEVMADA